MCRAVCFVRKADMPKTDITKENANKTDLNQAQAGKLSHVQRTGNSRIALSFLEQQVPLKSFILRILKRPQDVDDIAQETFIRAIKSETRNEIEFPRAYIYRIARNLAFEVLSKKHIQLTEYIEDCSLEDLPMSDEVVENEVAVNERMRKVKEAIADLPPQCQRVFIMHKIYGFKYREIASQLGISMSTVEKHIISGLRKCRHSVLEKENPNNVISFIEDERKNTGRME